MGKAKHKLHLFKLYRKNIELLCENPYYKSEVLKDIVVCPICFHTFKESDVQKSHDKNYLTIEHAPPEHLGGKKKILTCFKCNNRFSNVDKELNYIPDHPDSKVVNWRVKLKSDGDRFGAITEFDFNKNEVKFTMSNKDDLMKFVGSVKDKKEFNFEVKDKTREVGANLLKIAYLLAFHKFGYGLIMHPQYNFIRAQINNPYEEILSNHGVVHFTKDTILPDGVFLVKEPKELVSLLIRFKLIKQNGNTDSYSVHLPSPVDDAVEFYRRLSELTAGAKYVMTNFNDLDYWHDRMQTFAVIQELDQYRIKRS